MATQNFRVKNGLEVGSATTITSTDAFIGGNLSVTGVTTFQGQVNIEGPITTEGGASIGEDVVTRNLYSSGVSTFIGAISGSSASFSGNVTVGGVLKYEDVVNVDSVGIATARSGLRITGGGLDVVGVSTFSNSIDANGDLDVDGHTELDNLNVSGVSTFVGVSTFQDKVVFDSTNSIQIPSGDTSQRDPSPVAGQIRYNSELSSFEGYGPGNAWGSLGGVKDVNQDTYIIPESSAGSNEDILYFYNAGSNTATISSTTATVNVDLSVSGVSTFTGNIDANGDLDVDGHTELDNVNVSGFLTATSAIFSGDVTIGGELKYEDVVNVDSIGIATARSGLRITGGGLDVVGVSTFNNSIDANGDLDVDGHTELDNLNVSGVSTFVGIVTSQSNVFVGNDLSVAGDARVVGVLTVGSSSITLDGSSNTINVGTGATIHTTTVSVNQLEVAGLSTFAGIGTFQSNLFVGGTLYTPEIILNGSSLGEDVSTRNINASGIVTVTGATDLNGDLDVDGHTELDNLNVSGVSTFVGVTTTQDNLFVGNDLSVAGDARIVGVLTVGSGTITIDGSSNTINVGTGVTLHTTTVSVNQLEVAGLSTFAGIGTFQNNLFVGGTLYTPALVVNESSIGDDITTRNISASGIATVTGNIDANGDLDVDGHTELDNVNIAGVLTATSAEFSGNVTVLGDLTYENVVNVDSIGIATARSGLRVTGGGLNVVGVATFNNGVDTLDVIGHAEVDQLRVSGVTTLTGNTFVGSEIAFYSSTGIVSATSFYGDASNLTGIPAGLGTALSQNQSSPLNQLYYTDTILGIANTITVNPPDSSNIAYTQYAEIVVDQDADLIVEDGDDLIPDILGLSTGTAAPLSGAGGRIRADNFTSKSGTGAPAFPYGVIVTGVVTATSFVGDGSALTGIDATALKDTNGSVIVQAEASGVTVSGILTTPTINAKIIGYDNVLDSDITITSTTKTAIIHVDQDLTVDIEEGVTITIDDGCYLNIIS